MRLYSSTGMLYVKHSISWATRGGGLLLCSMHGDLACWAAMRSVGKCMPACPLLHASCRVAVGGPKDTCWPHAPVQRIHAICMNVQGLCIQHHAGGVGGGGVSSSGRAPEAACKGL